METVFSIRYTKGVCGLKRFILLLIAILLAVSIIFCAQLNRTGSSHQKKQSDTSRIYSFRSLNHNQ